LSLGLRNRISGIGVKS